MEVLRGARELIERCSPALLVEANDALQASVVRAWATEMRYREVRVPGVAPWNLLFTSYSHRGS
jgi:hypothetical protein